MDSQTKLDIIASSSNLLKFSISVSCRRLGIIKPKMKIAWRHWDSTRNEKLLATADHPQFQRKEN